MPAPSVLRMWNLCAVICPNNELACECPAIPPIRIMSHQSPSTSIIYDLYNDIQYNVMSATYAPYYKLHIRDEKYLLFLGFFLDFFSTLFNTASSAAP
jgi:hypothetical protein